MERNLLFPNALTPGADPIRLEHEEMLIQDIRAGVTPAQMVDRKLALLGEGGPRMRSQMQRAALSRSA